MSAAQNRCKHAHAPLRGSAPALAASVGAP